MCLQESKQKPRTKELLEKGIGMKQSFVVEIESQENHSWQGAITWIEAQKKEHFRSALEMLKLMDSTLAHTEKED